MKILCLDKGLGFSFRKHLLEHYKQSIGANNNVSSYESTTAAASNQENQITFPSTSMMDVKIISVSEPTSSNEDYEQDESFMNSIALIEKTIKEYEPTVLLCSSRGGKFIGKLVKDSIWNGPIVLISALIVPSMMMSDSFQESIQNSMIFAYGQEEKTVPRPIIELVKSCPNNRVVLLSYENDGHSMSSLIQLDLEKKEEKKQENIDWMNAAIETVSELMSVYNSASDDSVFEKKRLSLLELVVLSIVVSKIEKRYISKTNLQSTTTGGQDSQPKRMQMGMLNPSLLRSGFGNLKRVNKE